MSVQGKPLSGYVEMTQVQAAYIGSGNAGNGTLRYRGHTYHFSVDGLGVGGIGISKIEARGEVYGLERLSDFPGAYIQGRYGLAIGTASTGDLWLKNENGVIMRLVAKRQGLMLSLGGDAVVIQMNQRHRASVVVGPLLGGGFGIGSDIAVQAYAALVELSAKRRYLRSSANKSQL